MATIADKHYRSVLDSHYDDALTTTQNPTQFGPERGGSGMTGLPSESAKTPEKQAFPDVSRKVPMGVTGLEPAPDSSTNTAYPESGNALSDALLAPSPLQTALDALAQLTPEEREQLAGLLGERRE